MDETARTRGERGLGATEGVVPVVILVRDEEDEGREGMRWMPWRRLPMKDVGSCEKRWGAADRALIQRSPNGATPHPARGETCT